MMLIEKAAKYQFLRTFLLSFIVVTNDCLARQESVTFLLHLQAIFYFRSCYSYLAALNDL